MKNLPISWLKRYVFFFRNLSPTMSISYFLVIFIFRAEFDIQIVKIKFLDFFYTVLRRTGILWHAIFHDSLDTLFGVWAPNLLSYIFWEYLFFLLYFLIKNRVLFRKFSHKFHKNWIELNWIVCRRICGPKMELSCMSLETRKKWFLFKIICESWFRSLFSYIFMFLPLSI